MAGNQQAAPPVDGMSAGAQADRHIAEIETGEGEGVQQFSAGSPVVALGEAGVVTTPVARRARPRKGPGIVDIALGGLHLAIRVGMVVPGGGADTETCLLYTSRCV